MGSLRSNFSTSGRTAFSNRRRAILVGAAGVFLFALVLLYNHLKALSLERANVVPSEPLPLPVEEQIEEIPSTQSTTCTAEATRECSWDTIYDASPLVLDDSSAMDASVFNFTASRPEWLVPPPRHQQEPLVIRLGIISHPREFERRKALRQYVLADLPTQEVIIHYRFIMGYTGSHDDLRAAQERALHRDIIVLDLEENTDRMGEKRWRMLKWAADVPGSTYDYYMSADTDAFLRLAALARRLRRYKTRPALPGNPRETDIMWGQMGQHGLHLVPNPDESHPEIEDPEIPPGPARFWYQYPYGFGFLLSSHLVDRLVRPGVVLPHHMHYPSDDVLLGNWVADWGEGTTVVHDIEGFHDPIGHHSDPETTFPVDWDTVVAHHVKVGEMRGLRYMKEFEDEWDVSPAP